MSNPWKSIDETDLSILYGAVRHQIKTTQWDVTDEIEWLGLVALKDLESRLGQALDGL